VKFVALEHGVAAALKTVSLATQGLICQIAEQMFYCMMKQVTAMFVQAGSGATWGFLYAPTATKDGTWMTQAPAVLHTTVKLTVLSAPPELTAVLEQSRARSV
jgi:hypothetical protein